MTHDGRISSDPWWRAAKSRCVTRAWLTLWASTQFAGAEARSSLTGTAWNAIELPAGHGRGESIL